MTQPQHYAEMQIEPVDVWRDIFDRTELAAIFRALVLKHTQRAGLKGPELEDAVKAQAYCRWWVEALAPPEPETFRLEFGKHGSGWSWSTDPTAKVVEREHVARCYRELTASEPNVAWRIVSNRTGNVHEVGEFEAAPELIDLDGVKVTAHEIEYAFDRVGAPQAGVPDDWADPSPELWCVQTLHEGQWMQASGWFAKEQAKVARDRLVVSEGWAIENTRLARPDGMPEQAPAPKPADDGKLWRIEAQASNGKWWSYWCWRGLSRIVAEAAYSTFPDKERCRIVEDTP